jgi:hypothetical protein
MTRDEILVMPAGREMDALIWKQVYKSRQPKPPVNDFPSTDIACAWDLVEKLCGETGCDIVKVCKRDLELWGEWSCNFGRGFEAFGPTAPLAICRAALLSTLGE